MTNKNWQVYGKISGRVIVIGFGSIGRGMLPLLDRHFEFDKSKAVIIDPDDTHQSLAEEHGYRFLKQEITQENYQGILNPLLENEDGQGFCINLSVNTSSLDLMKLCREKGVLYIDTVVEPWVGFYFRSGDKSADRTNYVLRETVRQEKAKNPGGCTAVSCCGANPGMVSWFVKQALVNLARDTKMDIATPKANDREGWASLMQELGVKGVHIAERDTQQAKFPKSRGVFTNTWSVEGFISEGMQPAELGWGTHEKWKPENAREHSYGCKSAIYLEQPGADTRVRTWCPTLGAQFGFLVTHNESISIADYFTMHADDGSVEYRPTCHYAYHPADDAVLSLHEMFGNGGVPQEKHHILDEHEVIEGLDELGVLLYGHRKNAYWYGSQLSIEETRALAPYQNATGLQVSSAVLAGMVWALENPEAGIVEADEIDFERCLEIQMQYLGPVQGFYSDWTPLSQRVTLFPDNIDATDPWQFKNILVR
ncbi:MAG: homospermidine synthase [Bdellovibrionales bacterium]|nr:homospermidine synthase [Bdellovibrionales bacterium]